MCALSFRHDTISHLYPPCGHFFLRHSHILVSLFCIAANCTRNTSHLYCYLCFYLSARQKMGKVTFLGCCATATCPTMASPRRTNASASLKAFSSSCINGCIQSSSDIRWRSASIQCSMPCFRCRKDDVHDQQIKRRCLRALRDRRLIVCSDLSGI
jgi:hypothetical protein